MNTPSDFASELVWRNKGTLRRQFRHRFPWLVFGAMGLAVLLGVIWIFRGF